ncbi:MAG: SDR family NAD(P)-dependent oxidoreductase [Gammaproteobacteria bacterium]|nr:SDR family NAD(P)-dependent oxidoreductase [Gammaproteobacteria bacterium]
MGVGPALGLAVARRFAREGFAVALMARSPQHLQPCRAAIETEGGRVLALPVDATDPAAVRHGFEQVRDTFGPAAIFVYNAGAYEPGGILEITPDQFERCWKANCFGGFLGVQQALADMSPRKTGTVILAGATASLRGSAGFANLAVGKFGLRALAQSMAREFGPQGIHVAHVIIDGQIDTPRLRSRQPERSPETTLAPDAIAEVYWQLHMQSPRAWTLELDLRPAPERF